MEILRIEDVSFRYPKTEEYALRHLSLSVKRGEFLVICGASGCGKTTLLRLLKRELAPAGELGGRIVYNGTEQAALDERVAAGEIGFVLQNPDSQIVTDKVWHELAFGLESLGVPTDVIRRRVGEMAGYFGIGDWFRRKTDELSGGQKQLLNLAAVMVMQPKVLILDEPTGQLDPIAAADFIATLQKLNRELGLTVLLAEHRLEEVFPIADRVLMMEDGHARLCDAPRAIGRQLDGLPPEHPLRLGLPSAVRLFGGLTIDDECPLTVREGRDFLERHFTGGGDVSPVPTDTLRRAVAIELKNVWFRYERERPDVLRGTTMSVHAGEHYCLLGGNGTGKTTVLNVIAGLKRAYRGQVRIDGKPIRSYKGSALYRHNLALLPQNPQTVFLHDSVRADLSEILVATEVSQAAHDERIAAVAEKVGVTHLLERHPYDLSGGEQQMCALAKILLLEPRVLLLDEPTKGLDAAAKQRLKALLQELRTDGLTILTVTHDVEFAAETADRCALFFDGEVLSADVPTAFFAENNFYTTAANRMARSLWPHAVTCEQVLACAAGEVAR